MILTEYKSKIFEISNRKCISRIQFFNVFQFFSIGRVFVNPTTTVSLSTHEIKIISTLIALNKTVIDEGHITDTRYIANTLETSIYNARYLLLKLAAKGLINRNCEKKRQTWSVNYESNYFSNIVDDLMHKDD